MSKLKKLLTSDDSPVKVIPLFELAELESLRQQYLTMSPDDFAWNYVDIWAKAVAIVYEGKSQEIQMNFCTNPFCGWFGMPQERFESIRSKPSRYKLTGPSYKKNIECNQDKECGRKIQHDFTQVYSNWAIADEIARLARHDRIKDRDPEYVFHKDKCVMEGATPFEQPEVFYRYGENKAKSRRYMCRECRKTTNVLPEKERRTNYAQNKNEVLVRLARSIIGRSPVRRSMKLVGVGAGTYYHKLEWIYRRCLEFLERHERQRIPEIPMSTMWLNTDSLIYHLNPLNRLGTSPEVYQPDSSLETAIVVSADSRSRYVFRTDVAYDWTVTLDDIAKHTRTYHDDHMPFYACKHHRIRDVVSKPRPPVRWAKDPQSWDEYIRENKAFWELGSYVGGFHSKLPYTVMAHFWHIKNTLAPDEWRLMSDGEEVLISSARRVFADEIRDGRAHQFLYRINVDKKLADAKRENIDSIRELVEWGKKADPCQEKDIRELAVQKLQEELGKLKDQSGKKSSRTFVRQPIASDDLGYIEVTCITDTSAMADWQKAEYLLNVNSRGTDAFFQTVRRSLNVLERPLVGARSSKKSYIYANVNPKYAHQMLTFLRVHYNFCTPYQGPNDKEPKTPVQRLGLVDRCYSIEDILYFK
jgi:transposase-like protein